MQTDMLIEIFPRKQNIQNTIRIKPNIQIETGILFSIGYLIVDPN